MKKTLSIACLFLLIVSFSFAQSSSETPFDPGAARQTTTYTKTEVDHQLGNLTADLAQGNRIYYCATPTVDIGGVTYGLLSQSLDPVESTITIGPIVGTTYAQYSPGRGRITPAAGLGVTTIPAGSFDRVSFMTNSDTSGRTITGQYRLWRVDSAGAKIAQIATSTEFVLAALGASEIQRTDVIYAVAADVTVLTTDRLIEEYYFKRTGTTTGADPSIVRYIGGTHAGFISFALPSGVTMLTNMTNADSAAEPSITSITLSEKVKAAWAEITGNIYASGTARIDGQVTSGNGTAAAPAYSAVADPNTGVYFPAADTIGISANGAHVGKFNSSGLSFSNVSAGRIQLKRGDFIGFSNLADSNNSEYIYANNGNLEFGVNGITRQMLNAAGNLLVATSTQSLTSKIFVYDGAPLAAVSPTPSCVIRLKSTNGDWSTGISGAGTGDFYWYNWANPAISMTIKRLTNNVLIGTTTDDGVNKLQVNGGLSIQGTAPASAGATGVAGSVRWDANYIYVCVAADTWKRVAISTW